VTALRRTSASVCHVLREDSDLAEAVPLGRREQAILECTARELAIPAGGWDGQVAADPDGIGLLVMEGVLIRKVGVDGRDGAELLGEGDLLRPWQEDADPLTLRWTIAWRVLEPTRVAVLDERFARLLGRYPRLAGRLVARSLQRSRHLAVNMAIVHQARVDVRLHMLLWYLAGRWGRVRGDGVTVPIRLTHAVLADLVAARRPTVTTALTDLARQGLVRPVDEGWLLVGAPPGELAGISYSALQRIN
jgi:CRP/FNR family transcriptional regulator, cyclic AMP receptor protein